MNLPEFLKATEGVLRDHLFSSRLPPTTPNFFLAGCGREKIMGVVGRRRAERRRTGRGQPTPTGCVLSR
jgi:hypothetical protein